MLSRSLARFRCARTPLPFALACASILLVAGPADAARVHMNNVATDASHPESHMLGGGTLEGDIWGGEQITSPTPTGTLRESTRPVSASAETSTLPSWLGWWTRILDLLRAFAR